MREPRSSRPASEGARGGDSQTPYSEPELSAVAEKNSATKEQHSDHKQETSGPQQRQRCFGQAVPSKAEVEGQYSRPDSPASTRSTSLRNVEMALSLPDRASWDTAATGYDQSQTSEPAEDEDGHPGGDDVVCEPKAKGH